MASLRETIGRIRQRQGFPPAGTVSVRQLLARFSLSPPGSVKALIASDLIAERYDQIGRANGPIGFPMAAVRLTSEGAAQPFSGGYMVVRDKKTDPITAFQAEVRFLGFRCLEESNELSSSDEPYFIISITGKDNTTHMFGPFDGVDAGESRFTTAGEDVLVSDAQPPFTLSVCAMENDEGSPQEASDKVKKSCEDAIRVTQAVAVAFGQAQVAAVTVMLNTLFTSVGGFLSDGVSGLLGLDDDFVGSNNTRFGDWDDGQETWKTTPRIIEPDPFSDSPYNLKMDVGDSDSGEGKYTLYFNVNVFKIVKTPV